jgi:hypothetical protein
MCEVFARLASWSPARNAFWRVDPRPDGSRAPEGPLVETVEDKLELIAAGEAVSIAPTDSVAVRLRPDLSSSPSARAGGAA